MRLKILPAVIALSLSQGVLAQSAAVSGNVKDQKSQLPGAVVEVVGSNVSARTNHRGEFSLLGLAPGDYRLKVTYLGYEAVEVNVSLEENEHEQLGVVTLNSANNAIEEQVVIGSILLGEMRAINVKKNASQIVDAVSADAIGKLPDRNAAEAVQRLPGIAIERDQGEGRFVAIRGLPSEWSTNSINGDRLPTAEEETTSRATAFDFFPTEMIELVEVSKSVTAKMEGDAIGGNINFITRTAPSERVVQFGSAVNYNNKADDFGYQYSTLYGDLINDGKFGFLLNFTNWQRHWATDNFEPRRGGTDGMGIRRLELRDYTGSRETFGFNGAMEYNLDNGDQLFARGLYGTLDDDETHYKHRYRFDKDRVELQNIHNILKTKLWGGEIGGSHFINNKTTMDWKLSSYQNTFKYGDLPGSGDNAYLYARFDQENVGYQGLGREDGSKEDNDFSYNNVDGSNASSSKPTTHLPDGFSMNPQEMALKNIQLYKIYVKERDNIVAQLNFTNDFNQNVVISSGIKYRNKDRIAQFADEFWLWNEEKFGPAPTLADFPLKDQPGRNDYLEEISNQYVDDFSQVVDTRKLEEFFHNNRDKFYLDTGGDSQLVQNGGALGRHFNVHEDQMAAYSMIDISITDRLDLNSGLRLEYTKTDVEGQIFEQASNTLTDNNQSKHYLSVLPSFSLSYLTNENSKLRVAATRTFARPNFGDLSPGGTYAEAEEKYTSGNPQLDPTYSDNLDVMWEYYFENIGLASVGVFYKRITDPVYQATFIGDYKGKSGVTFKQPENGSDAKLKGLEMTLNHSLEFVHPALQNFGLLANYTYMDSAMKIDGRSGTAHLPKQAKNLYNLTAYYDNGDFSARIAMNYKGDYITEHGDRPDLDVHYGGYTSVDFNTQWYVNDQLLVYLEANNLTNEALTYYYGNDQRPAQVEYYGVRGQLGFSYNFF
ncbi:MAG: TonB-dependent receptor [Gammaproteobacteria bacterium]|nr:TonB-dependent receptor [Gammaproteobacteria bacterium]